MKHKFVILLALLLALALSACNLPNDNDLNCTMEYRYITIEVNGPKLDNFYTIRQSNGEIIRYEENELPYGNTYIVLGDNYHQRIKNSSEIFIFKGYIADSLVVDEAFEIAGDHCHINYISGRTKVDL